VNIIRLVYEKKGVSPLIATVLLIAFAIAILAVILSWSSTVFSCIDQPIRIAKISGKPDICVDNIGNRVRIGIENSNEVTISGLSIAVSGSNEIINERISDPIGLSETKKVEVPFDKSIGQIMKVRVTPILNESSGKKICSSEDKSIQVENIESCSLN